MTTDRDELADVDAAVRRALRKRIADPHLIDDLTQETLLRLARSGRRLTADEQRAYAVVTARNLLASHFRGQSVQRRHQHRLVEQDGTADPEERSIEDEQHAALASALTRLEPGERDLLLRHEVTGTDLATLAGEAEVSRGAIAMRLARARANLRLEFLLVFRHLSLPTPACRPVLLALAAGDRRRQVQLDAIGHVEACPTCATLLRPMTERHRRVAAWLVVPLGDAARRIRRALRSWWVRAATAAVLLTGIAGLVVLVGDPGRTEQTPQAAPDPPPAAAPAPVPDPPVTPATPATTATTAGTAPAAPVPVAPTTAAAAVPTAAPTAAPATASPVPAATAGVPPPTAAPAEAGPGCPPPVPLTEVELPAAIGCPFAVTVVTVVAVPSGAELRATVGASSVAIRLVGGGGLPVTLLPGARISIAGTLDGATGSQQLAASVDVGAIRLAS